MAETKRDVVFAQESGTRQLDGVPVTFTEGECWDADDKFVRQNPKIFRSSPRVIRDTKQHVGARVERGTRRPGESR